jgi:hypothetical protein
VRDGSEPSAIAVPRESLLERIRDRPTLWHAMLAQVVMMRRTM